MNICFIPNLGEKRKTSEPKWGAEFFAEAFDKHIKHELTIQHNLENLNEYDAVWVHNIPNLLKGITGRLNLVKLLMKNHPPLIGGVRGEVGFDASRHYLKYFDAIHTSNNNLTKKTREYNRNSFTISSGVDPSWYKPHPHPKDFTIGWAGDTSKNMKNTDLIRSLDVPTLWATKDNYIPHDEMPARFYNKINCLVHPSSHEGSCRVITEAAACGLPIICTNVGHNNTIVEQEWMFSLKNYARENISRKLAYFQKNRDLAYCIGLDNQRRAENYSWPKVITRCRNIVEYVAK